jgi:metal-responsive CopG/Arc/MetJ family transcriptional regulator
MKAKAHIVLAPEILEEVDQVAGKRRRSCFIEEATREKLEREKFLKVLDETKGAWKDKNHPHLTRAKDVEQYVREKRQSYKKRVSDILSE